MANLDGFFKPKSIAVIGAAREPGKVGYSILDSLRRGFAGNIYPINPFADKILGLQAYKKLLTEVRQEVAQLENHVLASARRECPSPQTPHVVVSHQDDSKGREFCFLNELGEKMAPHVGLIMKNDSH